MHYVSMIYFIRRAVYIKETIKIQFEKTFQAHSNIVM